MKAYHVLIGLIVFAVGVVVILLTGRNYLPVKPTETSPKPETGVTQDQPVTQDDGGVDQEDIPTTSLEDLLKTPDKEGVAGSSQPVSYSETTQVKELRKLFEETFKENFSIIKDEVIIKDNQKFWLATFEPVSSTRLLGNSLIKYSYETPQLRSKREYSFTVGKKGQNRVYCSGIHGGYFPEICQGDRISLPVPIGEQISNYEFQGTFGTYTRHDNSSKFSIDGMTNANDEVFVNSAGPELDYLGQITKAWSWPVYSYDISTEEPSPNFYWCAYAVFKAKMPVEFNLKVSPEIGIHMKDNDLTCSEIPIIIVPEEDSITIWPHGVNCHETPKVASLGYDYGGGIENYESPIVLRVGDLIKLEYYQAEYPPDFDKGLLEDIHPIIEVTSFLTDTYNKISRPYWFKGE